MCAKSFWSVLNICEATRFANVELKFILIKRTLSPDTTIRKISGKHNHSPTLQLSIFDGSAVLIRLCF